MCAFDRASSRRLLESRAAGAGPTLDELLHSLVDIGFRQIFEHG